MDEAALHNVASWAEIVLAAITLTALVFIRAPYGRHIRAGWGPTLGRTAGWVLMELPAVALFIGIYALGDHASQTVPLILVGVWQFHYVHRTFIFPFRMRGKGKRMPWLVVVIAIVFNSLNAYVNARWISHFGTYADAWLADPRLWIGIAVFATGFVINFQADSILINLRKPGESGYKIPQGGLYRFISSPNYLGEILEWIGWAIATWSLAGLAFALYTISNVGPRAFSNHAWYRETFEDYPSERRALIPFVA